MSARQHVNTHVCALSSGVALARRRRPGSFEHAPNRLARGELSIYYKRPTSARLWQNMQIELEYDASVLIRHWAAALRTHPLFGHVMGSACCCVRTESLGRDVRRRRNGVATGSVSGAASGQLLLDPEVSTCVQARSHWGGGLGVNPTQRSMGFIVRLLYKNGIYLFVYQ